MKEILKTVCAFTNTKGGIILIGVRDDGRIVGVNIGKGTLESITNEIMTQIEPRIYPEVSIVPIEDKFLIKIEVPEGKNKPYFYKGRVYKRVGRVTKRVDPSEVKKIIIESERVWELVERRIVGRLEDIDFDKVIEIINTIKFRRNMRFSGSPENFLKNIGVVEDGEVNLAGILLFGKNPQSKIPYAVIKAIRKVEGKVVDAEMIEGRLDEQVEGAMDFLRKHIPKRIKVIGRKRVEIWEVPEEALREFVVNAIVHRDYSIRSPIFIRFEDDTIKIMNPGELLPPLNLENIKKGYISVLRNPIIAKVFFYLRYIEGFGEGIINAIKLLRESGIGDPIFYIDRGFFVVEIKVSKFLLGEKERKVLEYLEKHGKIDVNTAKNILNVSERTARRILKRLIDLGYLKRYRVGRKVYYSGH